MLLKTGFTHYNMDKWFYKKNDWFRIGVPAIPFLKETNQKNKVPIYYLHLTSLLGLSRTYRQQKDST